MEKWNRWKRRAVAQTCSHIRKKTHLVVDSNWLSQWKSMKRDLHHIGTVVWFVQQSSLHDKPQYLLIGHALIGLLRQGGYFPQHHPERPAEKQDQNTSTSGTGAFRMLRLIQFQFAILTKDVSYIVAMKVSDVCSNYLKLLKEREPVLNKSAAWINDAI